MSASPDGGVVDGAGPAMAAATGLVVVSPSSEADGWGGTPAAAVGNAARSHAICSGVNGGGVAGVSTVWLGRLAGVLIVETDVRRSERTGTGVEVDECDADEAGECERESLKQHFVATCTALRLS